jgi:hypothetical protein
MNYIITWFYAENEELNSKYPQVNANSKSIKFQNTYWRCVLDFFYTNIVNNKNIKYIFYTNIKDLPIIDGLDVSLFFRENEVEIVFLDLSIKTPIDWFGSWRNQFYVFDIIQELSSRLLTNSDNLLILDSDCIITHDLSDIFKEINDNSCLVYSCNYDENHIINGLTKKQMSTIYHNIYGLSKKIDYYGGEFIALRADKLNDILKEFGFIWQHNFYLYEVNKPKLNEEAHFLSFIYERLNITHKVKKTYIKRLWNTRKYWNVKKEDVKIYILHMPAQKTTGFKYFFDQKTRLSKKYSDDEIAKLFYLSDKRLIRREILDFFTKIYFRFMNK